MSRRNVEQGVRVWDHDDASAVADGDDNRAGLVCNSFRCTGLLPSVRRSKRINYANVHSMNIPEERVCCDTAIRC